MPPPKRRPMAVCNIPFEVPRYEVKRQWESRCKPMGIDAADHARNWHTVALLALDEIHGNRPTGASAFALDSHPDGHGDVAEEAAAVANTGIMSGLASNLERLQHILNIIEVLYTDPRAPDIIAFLLNQVSLPMCRQQAEPANVAFREMRECIFARQWITATCWLVIGVFDSPRHFFFPERQTLRIQRDYPGVVSWMRDMRQRSSGWYLIRSFFIGASTTKDLCGLSIKLGDNARKYTEGVHKPTLLHHAIQTCRGRAHNSPMGPYAKLATFHGTTFEDMAREIYANLMGAYVFEIGTGAWEACPWYSQSPDGLVVRPASVHELQLPRDPLQLTSEQVATLCETTSEELPGAPVRTTATHLSAMLEIKCQYILNRAYDKCPDYYLNQLLQGNYVHGTPEAHFISMYYAPHHHGRCDDLDTVQITFEAIRANELVHQQYHYILREVGTLLSTVPEETDIVVLPESLARSVDAFPQLLEENLTRTYMQVVVGGMTYTAHRLSLKLEDALGSEERADYWRDMSQKAGRATEAAWNRMAPEEKDRWSPAPTPEQRIADAVARLELIQHRKLVCPSHLPPAVARSEAQWRAKLSDLKNAGAMEKFLAPATTAQ